MYTYYNLYDIQDASDSIEYTDATEGLYTPYYEKNGGTKTYFISSAIDSNNKTIYKI